MTAPDTPTHAPELASWKLVPVEADGWMRSSGHMAGLRQGLEYFDGPMAGYIINAAIAASPTPPVDVAALLEQVEVLRKIAGQKTSHELTDDEMEFADFEGGFDSIVEAARAVLNLTGGGRRP